MLKPIETVVELRETVRHLRAEGQIIGFVPTMGALHAGHLSLVEHAKAQCDAVIVSIFVNPMQFAAGEDLSKYPRTLEQDLSLLQAAEVEVVYTPSAEMMYPQGFASRIQVSGASEGLCGAVRAWHFDGVATVVTKLFNQVQPDKAFFGEKDFQQLKVIEKMVRDLDMPIEIIPVPTMREADGLAMSSRNRYLSEAGRVIAAKLYQVLNFVAQKLQSGEDVAAVLDWGRQEIIQAGFASVDYLELRAEENLAPLETFSVPARLLVAARLGTTRLIDNIMVEAS